MIPEQRQDREEPPSRVKRILIVDDEPVITFHLREALIHYQDPYEISTANDGETALEILKASPVDLLVTDLSMPGITGLDLIRWVRTSSPETRVLIITAYGDSQLAVEARQSGVRHRLCKPFDIAMFRQAVQDVLRDRSVSPSEVTEVSHNAPTTSEPEHLEPPDWNRIGTQSNEIGT